MVWTTAVGFCSDRERWGSTVNMIRENRNLQEQGGGSVNEKLLTEEKIRVGEDSG